MIDPVTALQAVASGVQIGTGNVQHNFFGGAAPAAVAAGRHPGSGPWRVFVSHTSELADFPHGKGNSFLDAALAGVAAAEHAAVAMRYFAASDVIPAEVCRQNVQRCDVYIGLLGHRYGSLVPNDAQLRSYTEFEFDTAAEAGLPRLMFLLETEAAAGPEQPDERQTVFRARVSSGRVRKTFSTPEELRWQVTEALRVLETQYRFS